MTEVFYEDNNGKSQLDDRLDGNVLLDEHGSDLFFYRRPVKIKYIRKIEVPSEENLRVSVLNNEDIEVLNKGLNPEEAASIIEDEDKIPEEDIFVKMAEKADHDILPCDEPEDYLSKNLYDGTDNELREEGASIRQADSFIEKTSLDNPLDLAGEFFKHLYEEMDISHISDSQGSMDAEDVLNSAGTDEGYRYNIFESFRKRNMICKEFSVLTTYVFRNSGFPAEYLSRELRYRENEDGISIADSEGDKMLPHSTSVVWNEGKWSFVDPSIYFHSRENGSSHKKSFEDCINRHEDGVYYRKHSLSDSFQYSTKSGSSGAFSFDLVPLPDKNIEEYTEIELFGE